MPRLSTDMIDELALGKFRILRHLGDGGMGAVYLGRREKAAPDDATARVFIKWIPALGSKDLVAAVQEEVDRLKQLEHPGIAEVVDFGEEDRSHFLVSEYVHGFSLREWALYVRKTRGDFPVDVAVQVVADTLRALHAAHTAKGKGGKELGIVHRDIMPSNVMLDEKGNVKLVDFGIARIVSEGTAVTDPSLLGKFAYLTPELVANDSPGPPSDVYGMALVLKELLTGENEFFESSLPATLSAIVTRQPTRADDKRSGLPAGLADVIAKALQKKVADRYQTAEEFAEALEACLDGTAEERRAKVAEMATSDFGSSDFGSVVGATPLADREQVLSTQSTTKPKTKPKVSSKPTKEEKARARFSQAGEVRASARQQSSAAPVVWKAAPKVEPPRMSEPPRRRRRRNSGKNLLLGLLVAVALGVSVAVVLSVLGR